MIVIPLVLLLSTAVTAKIAVSGVSQQTGLTNREMKALLDEHNALRSAVAQGKSKLPQAANMIRLDYSKQSASNAQRQASLCGGSPHGNANGEGQNFAMSTSSGNVLATAIDGWFHREAPYYSLGGSITPQNGHFTQMIWATSSQIGCGAKQCREGTRLVCNFKPPGNYRGQSAYKRGPPCSACPRSHPNCLEGLCSSNAQCRGKRCKKA